MAEKFKPKSQYGQDKRVLEYFNFKKNGFYVEIGVHDGEHISNTFAMDTLFNWKGVAIDPFMRNMHNRTCKMFKVALASKPGKATFCGIGETIGGLEEFVTSEKHNKMWINYTRKFPKSQVDVRTPKDVFQEAKVPNIIDFISLDVEGAEMDILKAFPFDEYKVGIWVIETNNDKRKEEEMRALMKSNGYKLLYHHKIDDYYVPDEKEEEPPKKKRITSSLLEE